MSSKDDPTPEERLNALLEDAGNNRVASGEASRLPVDVAEKALDELVTSARADEKKRGRSSRHRTQDALEAIFIESGLAQGDAQNVVDGLRETDGIDGISEGPDEDEPTLAGAQSGDRVTKPVRRLDDGIDFWNELETLDKEAEDD